jgi:hypothetical protein
MFVKIVAPVRGVAVALLIAAGAAAPCAAQPVSGPAGAPTTLLTVRNAGHLVRVTTCDPQRSVGSPVYGGFSPAFYPRSPYYWTDPYGFRFSQPALLPTSGTLFLDYTNVTTRVMKLIDFGLIANGRLVAEVRDAGTFSPNIEIKHRFGLNPNVFPLQTGLPRCVALRITYADGTIWRNPRLPALRRELYGPR